MYALMLARHKLYPQHKKHGMRAIKGQLIMYTSRHVSGGDGKGWYKNGIYVIWAFFKSHSIITPSLAGPRPWDWGRRTACRSPATKSKDFSENQMNFWLPQK